MGRRGDPLDVRNLRELAIRKPGEVAPPAPEPEEREDDEEEEEVRRRAELRDVRATSFPRRAFRRWGLLAPRGRDAQLRTDRLEGATWPGSRGRLRLLGHPSDVLPQWYLTLRRSDAMGTCQGQRGKDGEAASPPTSGKPPGQRQGPPPLTFPVPVVCPSQCCRFQGRHSAPRRAHGPSAEPHDALPWSVRAPISTPRHSRDAGELPAPRGSQPSEAPRGQPRACETAALRASGARRPRTPRAGRGRGGRSAPTAPPRPGPEGASGLRSHAPEVTSARPADPAQRRSAPSPKASAPPPNPQPWRQPR